MGQLNNNSLLLHRHWTQLLNNMNKTIPIKRGRPRDPKRVESKKKAILEVAARCFADSGYANTDVNTIAHEVGITKGTIYHYFKTKEALFLDTVDAQAYRMKCAVLEAADDCTDPIDEVTAVVYAYLKFAEENPNFVELLIEERSSFRDREQHTYFAHRDTTLPRWHQSVRTLIEQGRVRPCSPEQFIQVFSDTLYGTIFTNHFTQDSQSYSTQAQNILDVLLNGILLEPITVMSQPTPQGEHS